MTLAVQSLSVRDYAAVQAATSEVLSSFNALGTEALVQHRIDRVVLCARAHTAGLRLKAGAQAGAQWLASAPTNGYCGRANCGGGADRLCGDPSP